MFQTAEESAFNLSMPQPLTCTSLESLAQTSREPCLQRRRLSPTGSGPATTWRGTRTGALSGTQNSPGGWAACRIARVFCVASHLSCPPPPCAATTRMLIYMTTSLPPLFTRCLTRYVHPQQSGWCGLVGWRCCPLSKLRAYVSITLHHHTQGRASTTSFTEHRVPKVDFSSPLAPEMAANGKALNSGSFVVTAATVRLLPATLLWVVITRWPHVGSVCPSLSHPSSRSSRGMLFLTRHSNTT